MVITIQVIGKTILERDVSHYHHWSKKLFFCLIIILNIGVYVYVFVEILAKLFSKCPGASLSAILKHNAQRILYVAICYILYCVCYRLRFVEDDLFTLALTIAAVVLITY